MNFGILYFNVGDSHTDRLKVSITSVREIHQDIPICLCHVGRLTGDLDGFLRQMRVLALEIPDKPGYSALVKKVSSLKHTPFDTTLFLDADTVVLKDVATGIIDFDASSFDFGFVNFASWEAKEKCIKKRLESWISKGASLPDNLSFDDALECKAINVGSFIYKKNADSVAFLRLWEKYTEIGNTKRVFIPDEVFAQFALPRLNAMILPSSWGASPKYGPSDPVIAHFHGDKHQSSYQLCREWERVDANLNPGKVDNTVVVVFDSGYSGKLKQSVRTWIAAGLFRPNRHKLLVLTDESVESETVDWVFSGSPVRPTHHRCKTNSSRDLRSRMIELFVSKAPYLVDTPYWTKLDADCHVKPKTKLFHSARWRNYDIVSHRWGYTKPGSWIPTLEDWRRSSGFGVKPYDMHWDGTEKTFKHDRFQSFACFHRTESSRSMSDIIAANGLFDLIPSHDTLYSFLSKAMGLSVHTENLKKWGFCH